MNGWRERAADVFAKHGEIASKMKSALGSGPSDSQTGKATAGGWLSSFGFVAFLFLSWVIIPGFAFYKLGVSIWSIINEGWSACPVKDLIQESIIVLICLGVWGMILWAVIKRRKGPDPRITKM